MSILEYPAWPGDNGPVNDTPPATIRCVERMNNDVLLSLRQAQGSLRNTLAALETLETVGDETWFGRLAINADELLATAAGQFSDAMTAAGITLPRD